jgi:uncharacterized protein (TIGR03437 family)
MKKRRTFTSLAVLLAAAATLSAQTPSITAVLDAAALTANLAPGSVFAVKGTGLSAAGFVQPASLPYPTILNNARITLTPAAGGAELQMLMVYTYNVGGVNQLAGVIPSTVPPGAYDVRVINGAATSAPFRTTVVARKPGIVTADASGAGIAQATLEGKLILQRNSVMGKIGDFDTRPAHAGDRMDLWGTGLGADVAADAGTGTSGDQSAAGEIRVLLNGTEIVPLYAGRSFGYPGLDQIAFTIPANVALKCDNSVQVRAGGVLSNLVTIATSAPTANACSSSPAPANSACPARANASTSNTPTQAEVDEWAASGQQCSGGFSISRTVNYNTDFNAPGTPLTITREDTSGANFFKTTGSDLTRMLNNTSPPPGFLTPAPGVCNMFSTNIVNPYPNLTQVSLDAGTPLTVTGPNGARNLPRSTNSVGNIVYAATTGAGTPGNWMDPGTYTFTGPGSSVVGAFSGSHVVPPEFVVTNTGALATVNRATGLTVTWTGGDPETLVFITGSSFVTSSTGSVTGASFQCYENNTAGRFSVPVSVLQQLPASASFSAGPVSIVFPGSLGVSSISRQVRVLVPGIDVFSLTSSYNYSFISRYQ